MIQVYNYNIDTVVGGITPLTAVVSQQRQSYATAKVTLTTAEYSKNQGILVLGNKLKLQSQNCADMYTITNINVDNQSCTIECEHMYAECKKMVCTTYDLYTDTFFTVYSLVHMLQTATTTTTYDAVQFTNQYVGDGNTNKYQVHYYIIDDGGEHVTYGTPSRTLDPLWYQELVGVDFFGKTMEEIIEQLVNAVDINVIYLYNDVYFTFLDTADFFKVLYDNSTEAERYQYGLSNSEKYNAPDYYTGHNAQKFQYKLDSSNFVGAIIPNYTIEINNREEKKTKQTNAYSNNQLYIAYNQQYQSTYGTAGCKRYMLPKAFSTQVEWNRKMDIYCNVYNVPQGYSQWQSLFTMEYSSNQSDPTLITIPIYNIAKKQISTASGFAWNTGHTQASTTIYLTGTSTAIGDCILTPISGETTKFTLTCHISAEHWGGINFSIQPQSVWYTKIEDISEKPEEIRLVDCFGNEFGTVDFTKWTEADSGDPAVSNPTIWKIKYEDKDGNIIIRGHIWVNCEQLYANYVTTISDNVKYQAQVEVDSYTDALLNSLKIDLVFAELTAVIMPYDTITVWVREIEKKIDFYIDSITYDCINMCYTDIQTGFKQATLRELGVQLADIKRSMYQ